MVVGLGFDEPGVVDGDMGRFLVCGVVVALPLGGPIEPGVFTRLLVGDAVLLFGLLVPDTTGLKNSSTRPRRRLVAGVCLLFFLVVPPPLPLLAGPLRRRCLRTPGGDGAVRAMGGFGVESSEANDWTDSGLSGLMFGAGIGFWVDAKLGRCCG